MPINFPDNPTDNQEFNGYIYDATRGVWDVKLASDPLGAINLTSPAAGEALVFDGTNWVNQEVATPASVKTIDSDTIAIDFSDGIPLEKRAVTGDITFTGTNYTAGINKKVLLEGNESANQLTFPQGWNFLSEAPTLIGADKDNVLELSCFGTTESSVFASWTGPDAFAPVSATGGAITEATIDGVTYKIHTFTTTDTFAVSDSGSIGEVEYLVVAGGGGAGALIQGQNGLANTGGGAGGGGGHSAGGSGGGGGAGGYLCSVVGENSGGLTSPQPKLSVIPATYNVIIGAGGSNNGSQGNTGTPGSDSQFADVIASGGGRGAGATQPGGPGGSGGGADGNSTAGGTAVSGQGFNGGNAGAYQAPIYPGGGGGGAGAPGTSGSGGSTPGNGGIGISSNINGVPTYRAGGGGAGTGGAGGDGGGGNGGGGLGQSQGGSGVVIIRYPITNPN
jgi:hypothetical protein